MNSKIFHRFALSVFITLASPVCVYAEAVNVTDAKGHIVKVPDNSRIVSVGGAVTEIIYALGKQSLIAGVDSTSFYPPQALKEKPNVGYMRQLAAEGVLGLHPSLILSIEGAGPKETLNVLEAAQVPLVVVPDHHTGEGILDKIRIVADAVGAADHGRCLSAKVRSDLDALSTLGSRIDKPKRVLFVISLINGRAMVAGHNTAADAIIKMAGGVNVITEYDGYKPVSDEAVIAARPDVVLTMKGGGPDPVTADRLFALSAFAATPAAAGRSLVAMDGLYLLGFGPRSAGAARDLAAALYPQIQFDPLPSEKHSTDASPCRS